MKHVILAALVLTGCTPAVPSETNDRILTYSDVCVKWLKTPYTYEPYGKGYGVYDGVKWKCLKRERRIVD
jgi:hypothetical protein